MRKNYLNKFFYFLFQIEKEEAGLLDDCFLLMKSMDANERQSFDWPILTLRGTAVFALIEMQISRPVWLSIALFSIVYLPIFYFVKFLKG